VLAVLSIVTPVFALMGLGFLAAKLRVLPDGSAQVLAQFGFKIAMPALLFRAMLSSGALQGSTWRLLAAYFLASLIIWLLATLAAWLLLRRPAEDHAPLAMGAAFGNTVMLGVPIAITAFGPEVTAPAALLIAVETPLLWIMATLHMEAAKRGSRVSMSALAGVLKDLAANPIVASLVLGLVGRSLGLAIPDVPDRILALLGQAAVPTALFAMGMTLATFRVGGGDSGMLGLMAGLKLAVFPLLVWLFATLLFDLPSPWAALATLLAAMPVGANAFLFAARYDRLAPAVSAAIAVSTIAAVVTVSALLVVLTGR
jgi:malonate transporter and related proteins